MLGFTSLILSMGQLDSFEGWLGIIKAHVSKGSGTVCGTEWTLPGVFPSPPLPSLIHSHQDALCTCACVEQLLPKLKSLLGEVLFIFLAPPWLPSSVQSSPAAPGRGACAFQLCRGASLMPTGKPDALRVTSLTSVSV